MAATVLSNFAIGPKTIADASFGIVAPTTNSTGLFTYTSSDPAVATIVGNVATIVGIGTATITADQASNANFLAATISTTLQVSNNLWVAVGQGGNTVASSSDGILWKGLGITGFSNIANSIAYSNNLWVAVGNGINTVAYSTTNGNTWTGFGTSVFSSIGYRILYDPDAALWIAIGQGGNTIATSTTPKTSWTGQGFVFPSATCVYGPATNYSGAQNLSAYLLGGYSTGSLLANSLDGTTWQMGTTSGLACQGFNTIAYGNGVYVAGGTPIGTGNSFATSTDQISWTGRGGSTNMTNVNQITYGNGIFIAVGTKGTAGSTIMKSTDGITWTNLTNVYGSFLGRCVAYYQGRWIVGGSAYYGINYSDDNGTTWTNSSSSYSMYSTQTNAIGYGNDIVVSVGQGTGNTLAISTNFGVSWTGKGLLLSGSGNDIKYNDGLWLAVGGDNVSTGNIIIKSTDNGTTWTQVATSNASYFTSLNSVQNVNGTWYISGRGAYYLAYSNTSNPASISDFVFVSTVSFTTNGASLSTFNYQKPKYIVGGKGLKGSMTGLSWFDILNQPFTTVSDVYWNGTIWVGVGSGRNTLGYSYDGINWIGIGATIFSTSGNNVYYSTTNSLWIATGTGTNTIATSVDGINWTGRGTTVFTTVGGKMTYYNNLLIGVGSGSSMIASSTNGISWDTNARIRTGRTVAYINNQWIVGGDGATFATSTDGNNWRDFKPTVTNGLTTCYSIAYGNGIWVAVGKDGWSYGKIMYSTDGINWTVSASNVFGMNGYVYKVAYGQDGSGNGLWVAVGSGANTIATSTDGITWIGRGSIFGTARGVAYGNGLWVAVGQGTNAMGANSIATSTNGFTWTIRNSNAFGNGYGVAYGNGLWVAVGANGGGTATSTDGITWTARSGIGYYDVGYNVAYGNGLWVSVSSGQSFTSPDGITWTARANKLTSGYDVAYSNGLWVTCGYLDSTSSFVSTSTDGITWTLRNENVFTNRGYDVVGPENTVTKITTVLSNFSVPVKTFGDASFGLVPPTTNSDGVITYTSSNPAVATINGNTITIVRTGTSTITAYQANTANYSMGAITATFTVNKITTVLSNFAVLEKTFGDASFNLVAPTTNSDSPITYTSSNTAVATVSGSRITIVGAGTATITATQATTAIYTTGTIATTLTVNQATTILSNFSAITKTFGNAAFALVAPTTNSTGSFTYTSSNPAVATIAGSTVTIIGTGTATITATQASNVNFLAQTITTTMTVSQATPTITKLDISAKIIGTAPFALVPPISNSTGAFTYTSSDTAVATIDANIVTIVGLGITTITATQASTANYISGTISAPLAIVTKIPLSIATGQGGNSIATSTDLGFTWTGRGATALTAGYSVAGPATYDVSTVYANFWITGGYSNNGNTFATSTDGVTLTGAGLNSNTINGFACANNLLVAVSGGNSTKITYSTNGITWNDGVGVPFTGEGYSVAYGAGLWVAAGTNSSLVGNTVATSTNGINWVGRGSPVTYSGRGIAFGKDGSNQNLWVVVGNEGSPGPRIASSPDGITWTVRSADTAIFHTANKVAFGKDGSGNNLWVAVGSGNNTIATSTNGFVWSGRGKTIFTAQGRAVAYDSGAGLWVAVGEGGNTIATSTDGIVWTGRGTTIFTNFGSGVAYANNQWFAVGAGGNFYATSVDGINWTGRGGSTVFTGSYPSVYCVAYAQLEYAKPTYVAVGTGTNTIVGSLNGTTWTSPYPSPFTTTGTGVAWNGMQWVAVGSGGNTIAYSADGIRWTGNNSIITSQANAVAYGKDGSGNGLWVSCGSGGNSIATSTNGIVWTGRGATSMINPWGIAYGKDGSGNGLWVAVGGGNTIATSTNGIIWTGRGATVFTSVGYAVSYANNLWVAVGVGGNTIATSRNGTTWTGLGLIMFTQGNGIRYTNNLWVATGQGGNTMATSLDGTNWVGRGSTVFTTAGRGLIGPTAVEPTFTFTLPIKNIGDAPFTVSPPTSNSTGSFTYTSSNPAVATMDGTTITIVGMGTSTITAVQASTDFFISGTVSTSLVVENVKPTITNFSVPAKTFGDASFSLVAPTSESIGAFSYTSSNTAVATVSGTTITIVGGGTATITANQENTVDYGSTSIAAPLVVSQAAPVITNFSAITKTFGNAAFNLFAPTTNSTGAFTYTSSNTAVATIVANTVTIVGAGVTTITATQASTTNFVSGSISTTLTVGQATPTMTNFVVAAKTFGNAAFAVIAPTTNSPGLITYTSSNVAVATIVGTTITIIGAGSSTITASQESTANYLSGSVTATFTVNKATTVLSNFAAITKTFGTDASFGLVTPTTNSDGTFTYTSSNSAVATVSGSTVTIVGGGSVTITANQATSANYLAGSIGTTLTVNKAATVLSGFSVPTKTFGNAAFALVAPTSNSTGSFTYTSSNTSIARITGSTITIVAAGSVTITATQATTANYLAASITAPFTINQATILSNFSIPANKLVGDVFTLALPTSNSPGAFTYTSSNTAVATIDGNMLTVVGGGSSTISAVQASSGNYASATITATITITQITTVLSNFSIPAKRVGDADLITPPTTNSNGAFTYTSSNTAVATIVGNTITCVGVGTATITANQGSNPTYTPASITTTVQVTQGTLTLSNFSVSTKTVLDAAFTVVPPTTNSIGAITYTSSNASVATVNGNTITIVGLGSTTITASQATTVNYTSATISTVFQVIKAMPGLTGFSVPTKIIGNASFAMTPPTSNSNGAFTYTSSNPHVATFIGNVLAIRGVGTATITAVQATTATYFSETITATFQVNLVTTVLNNLVFLPKTFGDIPFKLQSSSNSGAAITYTSSDTSVATIVGDMATIVGAGTTTITASQESTDTYASATISETLTVSPITTVFGNFAVLGKRFGDASFNISPPSTNSNGAITYTSSNVEVATIAGNVVSIVGAGTSTITANQASTNNYSSATTSTTFTVTQATPVLTGFSVPEKTFGSASFTITPPNSNSNGLFTYTSSNSLVAMVVGNVVTVVAAGSCTITAIQASTANHISGIIAAPFVVTKSLPNLRNFSVAEKTFGSAAFALVPPTTNSPGAFTYTSSNTDVATIAGSMITIVGIGTSTITAVQATTVNFLTETITTTFTVVPGISTLANFLVPVKTIGDAAFSLVAPTTKSDGAFTYTSSNTAVATIDANTITIVGPGSSTITAVQASTPNFASAMISALFTVNRVPTVLSGFSAVTKIFGDASFNLVPPTSNSDGAITYTSSNANVATIVGSTVSIVGAGSTTITASQSNTSVYGSATVSATLTVSQAATVLSGFSVPAKIIGEADFAIVPPTTNSNGAITYTSSNPSVATVSGNTITLVGLGITTITAVQAATANYTPRTISATLPVTLLSTVLSNFVISSKTVADMAFALTPPTSNSTGTFTYVSSNLLVATIAGDIVTIRGTGTCTITAFQASTANSTSAFITASLVVNRTETIISNFSIPAKEFANAPFALVPPTTNSNGPITYTSSDLSVATISRNMVTIVGVGTSTITANQGISANYPSATISTTLVVSQGTPTITNFSVPAKTIGDASFSLVTPSSNSSGAFTYTSSNPEVATVDGDIVSIVGAGNATISAIQESTANFVSGTITATLQVERIITVLTGFSVSEKTFGDASFSLVVPSSNSDGAITYTSSNMEVCTIDGDVVTIVGGGNATITATQAGTSTYRSGTISALFKVNPIKTLLSEFSIPAKIVGEEAFTIEAPISNGNGLITYTSSNPDVATVDADTISVIKLGETRITAFQAGTANYTSATMSTIFQVKLIRTVLSDFVIPAKTVGDANFTLVPPTTNSSGNFTYASSNLLIATIAEDVVTIRGTGNVTIFAFQESTENSTSARITASLVVNRSANTMSWFSVPEKTFGSEPFTITPPTTASNGSFTYTSSDLSVATISRNVITIVGIGTTTITAIQAATVNYLAATIPSTFTVVQGTGGLSNFSVSAKTVGDASFNLVPPVSQSDGAITYTSSDPDVATIEGSTVTIVGVGSSTITATQESTAIFASGTITTTLTVNPITTVLTGFSVPAKTFGDASFSLVPPSSNSDAVFTYTSSNTDVCTIDDDVVTILEGGNAIITATQESTDDYTSATISTLFEVNKAITVLSDFSVPAKIIGEGDFTLVPPTTNSDGDITYTSSNLEVATIDDDAVTIVGLGTTIITARQGSTASYTSNVINAMLRVSLITTVLSNFSIPEKTAGAAPFTLDPPTTNTDGAFTYISSNLLVARIVGDTVSIVGVGTSTITALQASTPNSTSGIITTTLTVGKIAPTLTNFVVSEKAFGNASFTLIPPTSNSPGSFIYTSSNTDVATITRNVITIVGVGTSTITAVQASTSAFVSGTISSTFTVVPGTTILSNFSVPEKSFADASFNLVSPRTNSDGAITYTSSNTAVATIEGTVITIVGAGTSTITADQASNARYTSGIITTTFTVNPITTVLSNFSIQSKALGDATFSLVPPTTNSDGPFTYTSSKSSVATIDGDMVTIVGGGTSTITAVQASTTNYTSATITTVFRVSSLTTVLSNFTVPEKAVGDASFALVPPTTNGDGAFTYTSSNADVATVADNMVTIVGTGTSTIRAVQSSTENYTSAAITASLLVNKGTPTITNFTMPIKEIGMFDFAIIDPSSASTGAFTYTSSNVKVATIFRNTVSIKGIGTSTITATQAMSANYNGATATTPFVVNQMSPTLSTNFVVPATKTIGDAKFKLIPPKSNSTSKFAFTSSNTAVATIAKDMVTIVGAGTVIISATQPSTKSYGPRTVTGTMVVSARTVVLSNFSIARRIIGAAPFAIVAPVSVSNAAFTYTSSNPSVATVAGNMITVVGLGSSTITASQASTANFLSATISTTLVVNLPTPEVSALQITNTSMTNPSFTIVDPTKPNNHTSAWTYTSSENATVSGNEVTLLQPGIVTITGTLSGDSLYHSKILMTQFSISEINVAPSPFVFIRSDEVETAVPATVLPLLNTVIPLTVATPANVAKFNPAKGTIPERIANQTMIINTLCNMFPSATTITVPTTLIYVPSAFNKAKLKNLKIVRPRGTTVEDPLVINTIASDSTIGFLCSIPDYATSVQLNGIGSFLNGFIKISRGIENRYMVVRSNKGVSTSSLMTSGDVISFAGITAIIG